MVMIQSYKDKDTEKFARLYHVKRFASIEKTARKKLDQLEIAVTLSDLLTPPGNRLEVLQGDRKGQYSIRINNQYRICFRWGSRGPEEVEIVDYH